jgi:hypothetical protein
MANLAWTSFFLAFGGAEDLLPAFLRLVFGFRALSVPGAFRSRLSFAIVCGPAQKICVSAIAPNDVVPTGTPPLP